MNDIMNGVTRFRAEVFPGQREVYERLARDGQSPQALIISCSDSRVVPELITQAGPGDLFVCRNAGNMVPPNAQPNGGVSATIEYAVTVLRVRDIVVMGHSDCGAMKALLKPDTLAAVPNVAAWLNHGCAACEVVRHAYPSDMDPNEAAAVLAQENVAQQLLHLQSHPCVARSLAAGELTLHGWFFDLASGETLALDGELGRFRSMKPDEAPPAAKSPSAPRAGVSDALLMAAE